MTIQIEEQEYCKVKVQYRADADKVKEKREAVENEFIQLAARRPIKGFRAGKAPNFAVKLQFKKDIENKLQNELVSLAYEDILFETKMKPIYYPSVNHVNLDGSWFECELLFLKKPEFELKQYKGFEIPKPHSTKSAAQMTEEMLEALRRDHGDITPYTETDFVQMGDTITFDVVARNQDKQVDDLTASGVLYKVGEACSYPTDSEFNDAIMGMAAGETRSFDIVRNDQKITLTVTVHMGTKQIPCALDDSLAIKLGFDNFAALRKHVEGLALGQATNETETGIQQQIINRILEGHNFEVPNFLVAAESQAIANKYGTKLDSLEPEMRSKINDLAKKQVKLSLILDSIREQEPELELSESEVLNSLRQKISEAGYEPQKFLIDAQKKGQLPGMVSGLQYQATIGWLVSQSKVIEE